MTTVKKVFKAQVQNKQIKLELKKTSFVSKVAKDKNEDKKQR